MNDSLPVQLSLGVSLKDDATFANFFIGEGNPVAVHALKQFSAGQGEQNLLVWGSPGAGLTHLLQACCHRAYQHGQEIQYLPLDKLTQFSPESVCEGLDQMGLVCLDGIDQICGNHLWEQTLFHLINRLRDRGHRLLLASHTSPPNLPLALPDLKSRVLGSVIYHIHSLDDEGKAAALQMRAKARGMEMPDEVARFILSRAPRDTIKLFEVLNRLDEASLQQQRKLTIPFIKGVLRY